MKRVFFAVLACVFVACSQGPATQPALAPAMLHAATSNYRVLYEYAGKIGTPISPPLIALDGALYGISGTGGLKTSGFFYRLDQAGNISILHGFREYEVKGRSPVSGLPTSLVLLDGTFYATALVRSKTGRFSTAFLAIDSAGNVRKIRRFPNSLGSLLIAAKGQLYGVSGDSNGAVFSVTPTGRYHALYAFRGGSDGAAPDALLFANGSLYGTTAKGGIHGTGTVFSLNLSGQKRTIYSFAGGSDGAGPVGNLVALRGALYGTTTVGGKTACPDNMNSGPPPTPFNCGTIYTVTLSGAERVLHNFNFKDGAIPAGLTDVSGTLYGITEGDEYGLSVGSSGIYSITTAGAFRVLHRFGEGKAEDAWWGNPGLTLLNGSLFGSATGGDYPNGVMFTYRLP